MHEKIMAAGSRIRSGSALSAVDARELLSLLRTDLLDLMATARLAASGAGVVSFTCGIVNAKSGQCGEDCAYCAQSTRRDGGEAGWPFLPGDELLRRAERFAAAGVDYMGIVASGGGPGARDFDRLCAAASDIAGKVGIKLCASVGALSVEQAKSLKAAGFASCHHNLETAWDFFPRVCTTHTFDDRVKTVRNAASAGLRVCSGGLFGMGESWEQRISLSSALADLGVDSIPVNFLMPVEGTRLAGAMPPGPAEALAIIALLRLMHPARDLVVCGGRTNSLGAFAPLVLSAGANGLMVGDYLTKRGGPAEADFALLREMGQMR